MKLRHVASCGLVCAVLALTACDKGRQAPPEIDVRVVNVAPGFVSLDFRREQLEQPVTMTYKSVQEARYDVDTYDFFVLERSGVAGATPRTWTFSPQLQAERAYTFVLTEAAGEIVPIVLENAAAPAAEAQIQALHAATGMPALDLYLERPGVGIAGATPRGTFNAQEEIAARTLASGDHELWLTEAGNPANVLLASTTFALPAGVTTTFIVAPEPGLTTPQLSVVAVQGASGVLIGRAAPSELRVINGATDMAPRDFAIGGQFSPPLFSTIPFAEPTPYATVSVATQTINVTPVGNPGVLELNQELATGPLQRATVLFGGPAGTLTHAVALDDGRRIQNEAKLLFMNAATQFPTVEYVLVPPGDDPSLYQASAALSAPGTRPVYDGLPPGDYDLYLRQPSATALLSGPTRISLAAAGIYGVIAVNGADTATAGIAFFDDFP
jgi:hypothetical protein